MRRLTLLVAAPTPAARHAAFPALDEPIEPGSVAGVAAAAEVHRWRAATTLVAPERRARETAAALVLDATVAADLADIDMGSWRGRGLEEIQASEPGAVAAWMGDPGAAPPNGESVAAARVRVGRWLDAVGRDPEDRPLVVVTHTAVVRLALLAVLDAPIAAFVSVDAPALSVTELRHDGTRWALRGHGIGLGRADA